MLRLFWLKYLLNERTVVGFLERLRASGQLRELCGLAEHVPSESTCSRFFSALAGRAMSVEALTVAMVNEIRQYVPSFGEIVSIDGTDIESYSNPDRKVRSDPDAWWGVRTAKVKVPKQSRNRKKGKKKKKKKYERVKEFYWGYKMHCLADAR